MSSGKLVPFSAPNFRRFVVGSMLQTFSLPSANSSSSSSDTTTTTTEGIVANVQQLLSNRWRVQQQPFDAASTQAFYQRLGEFGIGTKPLAPEILAILDEMQQCLCSAVSAEASSSSPSALSSLPSSIRSAADMRRLLQLCGFMRPGDNLHRLVASHHIALPDLVHRFVEDHEVVDKDPFDHLRVRHSHNVFAIDSITTSEVDDAIGIQSDNEKGSELITVYVADATVHCPIYSELERFSARTLTTTTYLPEGVFFMLPERITRAATLRPDRPCRTFNINFRIDPETGELYDYSADVGWVERLRRVTYDQTQELLERGPAQTEPLSSSPEWMRADDVAVLKRIHDIATLRYKARERRAKGFTGSMPDPLIRIDKETGDVAAVEDQIICTKDARLAVAELMIAANEVCSRIAQANKVPLPFRGSRPLSSFHEAAAGGELVPPSLGYATLPSHPTTTTTTTISAAAAAASGGDTTTATDKEVSFFARTLVADMEKLRGVTRAYYAHTPVYHNGLDTHHYCHSTSPLRRYPDMLVHHQLKTLLSRQQQPGSSSLGDDTPEFVPEADMMKLCASCSLVQQRGKIMQMRSDRFWILRFLEKKKTQAAAAEQQKQFELRCFVGSTEYIRSNPETDRRLSARYRFRSDIFIPDVQLVHSVYHDRDDMLVGVTATCRIVSVDPYLDRLWLEVTGVSFEEDLQRQLSQMVTLIADS